jgi:outer membrane protein OmpA-like peptidoglycan-associated protein
LEIQKEKEKIEQYFFTIFVKIIKTIVQERFFIIIIFLSTYLASNSQNLVPNHSFEDAWTCPYSFVPNPVAKPYPGWFNPNKGTPDQFHPCSKGDAGVPENFAGFAYPFDGAAYAGIILREIFDDSVGYYKGVSREYIQTKLLKPLNRGKLYCFKLHYINANKSMFAVDALGVAITTDKIGRKDAGLIIQHPQVINKPGNIMDNQTQWKELCGTYRAKGNEQYLTIGNFWDNSVTQFIRHNNENTDTAFFYAYYYIDDVRLFEIENEFECGCLEDNSWGSDWLSDLYDPETGYNSGKKANANVLADLDADKQKDKNGNDKNNFTNSGSNIGVISDNSKPNNSQLEERSFFYGIPESEINEQAFRNAEVGKKFNLNRILFEFNSSQLLTVSFPELDKLSEILLANPGYKIEIRGHTDNVGTSQYNKTLSIKRAGAVYDYLISKGIDKSRMKYRGFGDRVPVADNETEEGRRLNRRVEIIIIEK